MAITASWRVLAILLAGAVTASVLASGQLAAWADTHAERPGGEALAAALHRWDDWAAPLARPRDRLHAGIRDMADRHF